ncbi:MAG TPA: AMP-binding protein, partial [Gemmatimonadaceae bacterium]|nr:AMP-binding protein [Gemmatimonadaceae bacterium]
MEARGGPRPAPGTLNQLFFDAADRFKKPDALQYKKDGAYRPISHAEVLDRVRRLARGLSSLGVRRGDRVALLSENRPEWAIADYACLTAGMTDVPIYPTIPAEQIAYILKDSGAAAIFVSNKEQAEKIRQIRGQLTSLKTVISFDELPGLANMSITELEKRGAQGDNRETMATYREDALTVKPDDLATIIYTSGTTGEPKGVMLTHDNIFSNVQAARSAIPFGGADTALSFLPLSHIFERMAGHYLMWATGTSIAYAESIDTVPINMQEVKPTLVLSVPRLYEKMYARVLEAALTGGFLKKKIFFWARGVADRWASKRLAGETPAGMLSTQYGVAQKLVFSKLKARTGGRLRYFVSGGAPLAP